MPRILYLLFLITFTIPLQLLSQDLILKKNGEVIKCRIDKEDSTNVYFTYWYNSRRVSSFVPKENLKAFEYNTTVPKQFQLVEHSVDSSIHATKKVMLEVNFTPFDGSNIISFKELQTKFWVNNKTVLRLGFQVDVHNKVREESDYALEDEIKNSKNEKSFVYGISPGFEYRFLSDSKLSPYIGLKFHYERRKTESQYITYTRAYNYDYSEYYYERNFTNIDGAWSRTSTTYTTYTSASGEIVTRVNNAEENDYNQSYKQYGGSLIFGADYFLMENLYLGFEIGLGFEETKFEQIEITKAGDVSSDEYLSYTLPSYQISNFGLRYNNAIRLGIHF